MKKNSECIVCKCSAIPTYSAAFIEFQCPACGTFRISDECRSDFPHHEKLQSSRAKVVIGHWLRRQQTNKSIPILNNIVEIENLVRKDWLPTHTVQADNLLRYIGDGAPLGEHADLEAVSVQYIIGAESANGVSFLAEELAQRGFCESKGVCARLTLDGWNRYDELKRGVASGNKAFMAMPFNRDDLDNTILPVARGAAQSCGFKLDRVDDQPKPGIIDVQIRVAIQEARFAIVDLTYGNLGAYWEAGYVEGMGKPVIYTVRADHDSAVHFDTAHLSRVIWDPENLDVAERQIKAMIQNELPDAIHEE